MMFHSTPLWPERNVNKDLWRLDAKSGKPFTEPEMMAMFQNVLTSDFKLQVTKGQEQGTIHTLPVHRRGPKFKESGDATAPSQFALSVEGCGADARLAIDLKATPMSRFLQTTPFWEL
jgi:uncharacterized protein (TIGR03435 family)